MNKFRTALNGLIHAYPHIEDDIDEVIYRQYQQGLIAHSEMTNKLIDIVIPLQAWAVVDRPEVLGLISQLLQSNPYRHFDTSTVFQVDPLKIGRIDEDGVYVINPPIIRITKSSNSTLKFSYRATVTSWIYTYGEELIAHAIMAAGCDHVRFAGVDIVNATRDYDALIIVVRGVLTNLDDKCRKINQRSYARAKAKHLAKHS